MNRALLSLASTDASAVDAKGLPAMFEVRTPDGSPVSSEDYLVTGALTNGEVTTDQELQVRLKNGRFVPILRSAAPVRDPEGRITGAVAVVRDITSRKELERLREEWASIIAHDLRQPVAAIALTAESLLALRNEKLSDHERRSLQRIRSASQRLGRMIEDLLDFSRIEANRLSLQPRDVDFRAILDAVVESHRETNDIHVVGASDQRVSVDPDRIHQVLDNLISNGVKYGRPGGEIRIRIARSGRAAGGHRHQPRGRYPGRRAPPAVQPFRPDPHRPRPPDARHRPGPLHRARPGRGSWRPHLGRERSRRIDQLPFHVADGAAPARPRRRGRRARARLGRLLGSVRG